MNLYLHEIFLRFSHSTTSSSTETPFPNETQSSLDIAIRNIIATCILSVRTVLDTLLSLTPTALANLPLFNYVRTAYTVITLMRIYFAVNQFPPDSPMRDILMNDDLGIDDYLDRLLRALQSANEEQGLRAAGVFSTVLFMLRTWFVRKKEMKDDSKSGNESVFDIVLGTAYAVLKERGVEKLDAESGFAAHESREKPTSQGTCNGQFNFNYEALGVSGWNELDLGALFEENPSTLLETAMELLGQLF